MFIPKHISCIVIGLLSISLPHLDATYFWNWKRASCSFLPLLCRCVCFGYFSDWPTSHKMGYVMSIWFSNRLSSIISYILFSCSLSHMKYGRRGFTINAASMAYWKVQTKKSLNLILYFDHYFEKFNMRLDAKPNFVYFCLCGFTQNMNIWLLFNFRYVIGERMNYKIVLQLNGWHYWIFIEVSHFLWF